MPKDNLISLQLTAENVEQIRGILKSLEDTLKPDLVALSPTQKKDLAKVGNRMVPFINKVLQYVETNPEFVPTYLMNVAEFRIDVAAVNLLSEFYSRLNQLVGLLEDTMMLSGSEGYQSALQYYNAIKQSAKAGVPAAQVIYADLKVFFSRTRQTGKDNPAS